MFSATDIADFLACPHTATLDRAESRQEIKKPFFADPMLDLLRRLGIEHERRYLQALQEKDRCLVTEIARADRPTAAAATVTALRSGAAVVYQGVFADGKWNGRPDFLLRVSTPSELGDWSYEATDTKLARSAKAGAIIQLCFYSDMLSRVQGLEPRSMRIVLGGGAAPEEFYVPRYSAYFRKIKREFEEAWNRELETYPEPVEHCDVCSWSPICDQRRRADDHLSLVAGITRNQRKALVERDIMTLAALGSLALPMNPKMERMGDAALRRIRDQARLQLRGREEGRLIYELIEGVDDTNGLGILPEPSPADVFLDFEANPYVLDEGLEYLTGFVTLCPNDGEPQYEAMWASTRSEEKRAFETFIARVMERWRQNPAMHIFHYAPYEPTAIKRLAGRHGTCIDDVDELLRAGVFVDLYRAVRQGLRASVESYSIKRLEPIYEFTRSIPLREANTALQSYEAAMALGSSDDVSSFLRTIEGYNRDDCMSALRLRNWLEDRRKELETSIGRSLPRPAVTSGQPSEELSARLQEIRALMARLTDGLPDDETQWTPEQRARWLLAQLLEWHRREQKSEWWEYFRLRDLSDEELQEDGNALGGLTYVGQVGQVKRSIIHRYKFPPQEHTMDRALEVRDPRTEKNPGQIVSIDDRNGLIDLKRGIASAVPHPTALIPYNIVNANVLSDSIFRLASWVADNSIVAAGDFQAGRDLLLRTVPSVLERSIDVLVGEDGRLTASASALVERLPRAPSVLPIQGPPGSGKTHNGARMIVELVKRGYSAGITAVSHKVISKLLHETCIAAAQAGVRVKPVQKANDVDGCTEQMVVQADDNQTVHDFLASGTANIGAGTAWLWARPEMAQSVDVLFVDEAGQSSLANVLAISQAATSVVLLGDPQQLDQPQKGIHPPGADASALGHLLDGHATISSDRGIFLSETRRLHPDVCAFTSELFYDGRLVARPENAIQLLDSKGPLTGTGLRFISVEHSGNQTESPEEVEIIAGLIDSLLQTGTTWTDKNGTTRPLTPNDILIVAPYNAQVAALAERIAQDVRVGTVDKFQGQEAPVVFYSMATSTPEEAPRGMEFLYNLNRLNVATSRAQGLAVIVASPTLLQVQCKTPHQIELANALCRYLEMAVVT